MEEDGGAASLFDGMVLFAPSDGVHTQSAPPSTTDPANITPAATPSPTPRPDHRKSAVPEPLDEDLFSDLTLVNSEPPSPPPTQPQARPLLQSPELPAPVQPLPVPVSRQISRKKKRAVRIGYARESPAASAAYADVSYSDSASAPARSTWPPLDSTPHVQQESIATASTSVQLPVIVAMPDDGGSRFMAQGGEEDLERVSVDRMDVQLDVTTDDVLEDELKRDMAVPVVEELRDGAEDAEDGPRLQDYDVPQLHVESDQGILGPADQDSAPEDEFGSIEERLLAIKAEISQKLEAISCRAAAVMAKRKELGAKRRRVAEKVASASARQKELEAELSKACEIEDFEKAESISESIQSLEKDKDELLVALKDVELEYDSAELEMQEFLELHIKAEEESSAQLQQFSMDATDFADSVKKKLEESFCGQMEGWQASVDQLETKLLEIELESQLIMASHSDLESSIEHLVEDDRRKQDTLKTKGDLLAEELTELLRLVRSKEEEIALNNAHIQEVEYTISSITSEYREAQSSFETKLRKLAMMQTEVTKELAAVVARKNEIDNSVSLGDEKQLHLKEIASASLDEAKTYHESACLRQSLATSILKSREDRVNFAKMEENILDNIQILKQENAQARVYLQELSARRTLIQQEISTLKQRASFIHKRGPELEAEKKAAAIARNFREAGRIATEAKALTTEMEETENKLAQASAQLEEIEKEVTETTTKIQESELLVEQKEKEFAMAACNRLQLVSAAARAERDAAIDMGDVEEGDILLKEAISAESKVKELQESYGLPPLELDKNWSQPVISIAFITNLAGKCLNENIGHFTHSSLQIDENST